MSRDRKNHAVKLQGIPEDINAEWKQVDLCLKCDTIPHQWFQCDAISLVVIGTVPNKRDVPEVGDTLKK